MNTVLLYAGGTDPSGGAGLPADLKTASAFGFHGCPVTATITVQNSGNVLSWSSVDPAMFLDQLRSVSNDGPVAGVKSGMLGSVKNASTLAEFLRAELRGIPYVLDPVLSAGGGGSLAGSGMTALLRNELIPLCSLCTPNIAEAEILSGMSIRDEDAMTEAGKAIIGLGAAAVLVKGGHLPGRPVDILITEEGSARFEGFRITSDNVHGTGCTLGSAALSLLAGGFSMESAVRESILFVRRAIARRISRANGYLPGHFPGAGPLPGSQDGTSFYLPPAYCTVCGNSLDKSPGEYGHLFCSQCGSIHYRNPLPAVALMVHDRERILLVRRAVPPKMGMLSLPGGFLETGETPKECGCRELLEETSLSIRESKLIELETDMTAYGGILLAVLEVTRWEGIPAAGDDASEVLWCSLRDVPELAFNAHNRLIDKLTDRIYG